MLTVAAIGFTALFAYGGWLAYNYPVPKLETPVPTPAPEAAPRDYVMDDEEFLDEFLAVEVETFIASVLGEVA